MEDGAEAGTGKTSSFDFPERQQRDYCWTLQSLAPCPVGIHLELDLPWSVHSLKDPGLLGFSAPPEEPPPSAPAPGSRTQHPTASCLNAPAPLGRDPNPAPLPLAPRKSAGARDDAACQGRRLMAGPLLSFPAPSSTVWLLPALGFGDKGGGREGKCLAVPFAFFLIQGLLLVFI